MNFVEILSLPCVMAPKNKNARCPPNKYLLDTYKTFPNEGKEMDSNQKYIVRINAYMDFCSCLNLCFVRINSFLLVVLVGMIFTK